jgi:hypothetical protein
MPDCVTIRITEPLRRYGIGRTARNLCRSLALDEAAVVRTIGAVTDIANHLFHGPRRRGCMRLSIIRSEDRYGLEVAAENEGPGDQDGRPLRIHTRLTFPRRPSR